MVAPAQLAHLGLRFHPTLERHTQRSKTGSAKMALVDAGSANKKAAAAEEMVEAGSGNKIAAACSLPPAAEANPAACTAMKTVMVPDAYIKKLMAHPLPRLSENFLMKHPKLRVRAAAAEAEAGMRALIKVEQDILDQYFAKGHAMVEVREDLLNQYRAMGYTMVETGEVV